MSKHAAIALTVMLSACAGVIDPGPLKGSPTVDTPASPSTTPAPTPATPPAPPAPPADPAPPPVMSSAVRSLAGLSIIRFVEITTIEREFELAPASLALAARLPDPLDGDAGNWDFSATSRERYDVFYSDADGTPNVDGAYVSIEARCSSEAPGSGLNIAEVYLVFSDGREESASVVGSWKALGENADPSSIANAIDSDPSTYTTMGNTAATTERLRITLGFASSVP